MLLHILLIGIMRYVVDWPLISVYSKYSHTDTLGTYTIIVLKSASFTGGRVIQTISSPVRQHAPRGRNVKCIFFSSHELFYYVVIPSPVTASITHFMYTSLFSSLHKWSIFLKPKATNLQSHEPTASTTEPEVAPEPLPLSLSWDAEEERRTTFRRAMERIPLKCAFSGSSSLRWSALERFVLISLSSETGTVDR